MLPRLGEATLPAELVDGLSGRTVADERLFLEFAKLPPARHRDHLALARAGDSWETRGQHEHLRRHPYPPPARAAPGRYHPAFFCQQLPVPLVPR